VAYREVQVDAESLLKLLVHYTDGDVPLDSELRAAGVSPILQRMLCFWVDSSEWPAETLERPLHIRYSGKKILSWNDTREPAQWQDAVETPKIQ
jgi:hypothetical protein